MNNLKKLGISMDHSVAHLIEFIKASENMTMLESLMSHQSTVRSLGKNENQMHHKEPHLHVDFYNKLGNVISQYNEVILFGPSDSKNQLFTYLKNDMKFDGIKIHLKNTLSETESQQMAFVKDFFQKQKSLVAA
jgi:stalled ribosome rescue protein Dom34